MSRIVFNGLSHCSTYHGEDLTGVKQVEGQGRDEVEQEPTSQVVKRDSLRVRHNLALLVDKRRPEIQHDV